MSEPQPSEARRLMWLALWCSAAVLAFEIALMRVLLGASWHHFAFLVISIALLGFGASGTWLTIARPWLARRGEAALLTLALLTALSMPLCAGLAQHLPIEARFAPALFWRQASVWALYWLLLAMPFFFGAAVIAACLMSAGPRLTAVYGANLLGSAAGAIAAPLLMLILPPSWLAAAAAIMAWIGAAGLRSSRRGRGAIMCLASLAIVAAYLALDPPAIRLDPYKYAAHLQRLVDQGGAARIARHYGPRAMIEVYQSAALHDLPFLAMGESPPPLSAVVIDGHWGGSLLDIADRNEARVVDQTLMATAYDLAPPRPRVALLGEIGGSNIWLALRRDATAIDVVQPQRALFDLLRGPLRDHGGSVLDQPGVRAIAADPRHFIEQRDDGRHYDLIQFVTLEGSAAGTGGIGGLGQDYLITVQGLGACLRHLTERGVLTMCRGIQTPPRDNLKLLATLVESLRRAGVDEPQRHIVIVRDYLAVCTMARLSPWTDDEINRVREVCRTRQLTPSWFNGIRIDELNQPDALPGPPDSAGDWYHEAALQLFSPQADRFIEQWPFDIRPPTDDRPFFLDFCRLKSISALRQAFGDLWLTRAELAYLFAIAATVFIAVIGGLLTLVPLIFVRSVRQARGRSVTAAYFAAIGLGYMLLEMTMLARLTLWIGESVLTAAVVIASFLVFSGAGSLSVSRVIATPPSSPARRAIFAAIVALALVSLLALPAVTGWVTSMPLAARCAAAAGAVALPAYLMGFPMPMALARLDRALPALVPWAWGVNGFASVLAAPLATVIGMTWGFHIAAIVAAGFYALAGAIFARLPA